MNPDYEIRRYRAGDKARVAALAAQLWSCGAKRAAEYFTWKYDENPFAPEPSVYLAFQGDELAGIRGFYGGAWESGLGSAYRMDRIPVADDFIIAPAHRNSGLATTLMRAALDDLAERGVRHVLNLTGSQVTVVTSLAMGWKSAGQVEPVGRTSTTVGARIRKQLGRPLGAFDAAGPRLDAMAELVERLGHDGRIRHVRSPEYLAWRFRNPLADYRFLYRGAERLEGYLVLRGSRTNNATRRVVRIADLEGTSAVVRAELLRSAVEAGSFPEITAWAAALPPDAVATLAELGFVPVQLEARAHGCPCVLVKPLGGDSGALGERSLLRREDWDLRMLATMAG